MKSKAIVLTQRDFQDMVDELKGYASMLAVFSLTDPSEEDEVIKNTLERVDHYINGLEATIRAHTEETCMAQVETLNKLELIDIMVLLDDYWFLLKKQLEMMDERSESDDFDEHDKNFFIGSLQEAFNVKTSVWKVADQFGVPLTELNIGGANNG